MRFLTDRYEYVTMPETWRPRILRNLRADFCAKSAWYYGTATRLRCLRALLSEGTACTCLFRLASLLHRCHLGFVAAVVVKMNSLLTGATIGAGAEIGPGLAICHTGAVVIYTRARLGTNVIIQSGVTIGVEKGRAPVLGDNVFVGTGAKVIGGIRVGNGVRIGANAVVVKDVPDGATAVGVPAKLIAGRGPGG
jgi:serine O-acetyltransferase